MTIEQSTIYGRINFTVFLVIAGILVIDLSFSNVSDIIKSQIISDTGIAVFVILSLLFCISQPLILKSLRAINISNTESSLIFKWMKKIFLILQCTLVLIIVIVNIEILFLNYYESYLLIISTTLSYALAIIYMMLLAYHLISWFKINKGAVTMLYSFTSIVFVINAIDTIIIVDDVLWKKETIITSTTDVIFGHTEDPGIIMSLIVNLQGYTVITYFILTWAATVLILRHNLKRIGKIRFWMLTILPLVYFMGYYVTLFNILYPGPVVDDPLPFDLITPILLMTYSTISCGILFGFGFRSIARSIQYHKKVYNYMMITSYGFVTLFISASATVLQTSYPPFGLLNVSFVGLSSYLIFIGLFNSAISISKDQKLRDSIRNSVLKDSQLLDNIGTAEMVKRTEEKYFEILKKNKDILSEQNRIDPSISDDEIRNHIRNVIDELKPNKRR